MKFLKKDEKIFFFSKIFKKLDFWPFFAIFRPFLGHFSKMLTPNFFKQILAIFLKFFAKKMKIKYGFIGKIGQFYAKITKKLTFLPFLPFLGHFLAIFGSKIFFFHFFTIFHHFLQENTKKVKIWPK